MKTIRELVEHLTEGGMATYIPEGMGGAVIDDVAVRELAGLVDLEIKFQEVEQERDGYLEDLRAMVRPEAFSFGKWGEWGDEFRNVIALHVEAVLLAAMPDLDMLPVDELIADLWGGGAVGSYPKVREAIAGAYAVLDGD